MDFQPISPKDTEVLRGLAARQAEIACAPAQNEKAVKWKAHNDLRTAEPLVFIDPEIGWREVLPPEVFLCEGALARGWEKILRKNLFWADYLRDDKVTDDIWRSPLVNTESGWGLEPVYIGREVGKAFKIQPVLVDYERDFEKLRFPEIVFDDAATQALRAEAERVFCGILRVEPYQTYWWSLGLTRSYIDLRGLGNFLCDFIDEPEWLHRVMGFLCDGTIQKILRLEKEKRLFSNNGNAYVGSGGFGYTDCLPRAAFPGAPALLKDMWGFVESQETVSISPAMYGEFIFPYHKKIASLFGLNCFGCCEPFEGRWEYAKRLPGLRRISVSPWSNRRAAGELLGAGYISSHKLSPSPLAIANMDEALVRRQLREALDASKGCPCELIMKDTTTLGGDSRNAVRWVEIAREEINR